MAKHDAISELHTGIRGFDDWSADLLARARPPMLAGSALRDWLRQVLAIAAEELGPPPTPEERARDLERALSGASPPWQPVPPKERELALKDWTGAVLRLDAHVASTDTKQALSAIEEV